jgi:GNAT superfamily N-acetyltransferase
MEDAAVVTPMDADADYSGFAGLRFVVVSQDDPLASPLLDELEVEYSTRYGDRIGREYSDLRAYPGQEFAPPGGVLVVAVCAGVPVAGGAFRRYDSLTAELKRIWTATGHRKRGYGKLVVAELERIAGEWGYTRIYLTTGPRQPEAVGLYLSMGYTPLYDPLLPSEQVGVHPFEKVLVDDGRDRPDPSHRGTAQDSPRADGCAGGRSEASIR